MNYKDLAIKQLEFWGWDVEKFRLYGLPWYLKLLLYPVIWGIEREVEAIIDRLIDRSKDES